MLWKKQRGNSESNVADCMTTDGLLIWFPFSNELTC